MKAIQGNPYTSEGASVYLSMESQIFFMLALFFLIDIRWHVDVGVQNANRNVHKNHRKIDHEERCLAHQQFYCYTY